MTDLHAVREAAARVAPHIRATPLRFEAALGAWLKCEHHQITGSFKLRGALNKVLSLDAPAVERGLVAASAGNHGLGVAHAARLRGARVTVVVPAQAVPAKVEAIRALGAEVLHADGDYAAAEREGRALAARRRAVWVSPYNDPAIVAGQGTLALDLIDQIPTHEMDRPWAILIPASGGGLLAGMGVVLKALWPHARVIGVQPAASPYLHAYLTRGTMDGVDERPTLADGLAGAVDAESITLDIVRRVADEIVLVDEPAIEQAILRLAHEAGEIVEPSGAAALAARAALPADLPCVAVLTGANIDRHLRARLLGEG